MLIHAIISYSAQMDVCKVLAKSLVQSKKAKTRIITSKAQINSVMTEIQNQMSKQASREHLAVNNTCCQA